MGFFPLIWVSMTLMASAQHAEVPAPLPAPVPGLINTVPLSQSLGSFDLLQCLAAQPPAFPFLSACLPSREPPSLCSSREFTPLPLFAALSPGQSESCVFPHTRCHFGHSKQCHPDELPACWRQHSFPDTLGNSSIFTRSNVHRITN